MPGANGDVEATAAQATQANQASQYPSGIRSAPVDAFFGRVYGDKYIGSWVFPPLSVVSECHFSWPRNAWCAYAVLRKLLCGSYYYLG